MRRKWEVTKGLLVRNALIGVVIALVMHFWYPPQNSATSYLANLAADVLVRLEHLWINSHRDPHSLVRPLVFVDIDDETHRAWGQSRPTPKRELAELLTVLLAQKPTVIVVDLDLSGKSGTAPQSERLVRLLDEELRRAQEEERPSRIILARRVITEVSRTHASTRKWLRPLFFEEDGSIAKELLARQLIGTVTYALDDDGVVRRWHLLETGCRNETGQAALSVQLLVAAYIANAVDRAEEWRTDIARDACVQTKIFPSKPPLRLSNKLVLTNSDLTDANRMVLRFDSERPYRWTHYYSGEDAPLLRTVSAAEVLRPRSGNAVPRDLKNAIIVVGATHYDSGDRHMTPIGEMPGSFLVLNSIYSLLEWGPMRTAPWGILLVPELALLAVLAIIFTFCDWLSIYLGIAVGLALLFLCALVFFFYGVWFDYFTPLLGVFIHQWYRNIHQWYRNRKNQHALVGPRA